MPNPSSRDSQRFLSFDRFEERVVFSGQPLSLPLADVPPPLQAYQTTLQGSGSGDQFGLAQLREQYQLDGTGQTVAVIDSGIAWDHVAFGSGFGAGQQVVGGWDFAENDANPYDDGPAGFHGTHVAGIVGSRAVQNLGVAPGADLVALRVFDDQGQGKLEWVEQALRWVHENKHAFANPITTINLSLGGEWNGRSLPNWAILEDEFAQLKQDGIFISVAAGNAFSRYLASGLSYPAVSSHVIPVASSSALGLLSSFSQRDARVLVAPGEDIRSAVPDFLFHGTSFNRFLTSTGTSMAAPYVAGASTLVREALEFMGDQDVTQSEIYDRLWQNADQVFDQITGGWFRHLNLPRALASILQDDYRDQWTNPNGLGTLSGSITVAGTITTRTDLDIFEFTAAKSGRVTIQLQSPDGMDATGLLQGTQVVWENNQLTFDVVAGNRYAFSVGSLQGTAHYQFTAELTARPGIELGAVAALARSGDWASGEMLYRISASREGLMTALSQLEGVAARMEILSEDLTRVIASGTGRLDWLAQQGEAFVVRVVGEGAVGLQIANLVTLDQGTLTIHGTTGDDRIDVQVGPDIRFSLNGIQYQVDRAGVSRIEVRGAEGHDQVHAGLTSESETMNLGPHVAYVYAESYQLAVTEAESISLDGGAGADSATVYDSAGNDSFVLSRHGLAANFHSATLELAGTETIQARAGTGYDIVLLRDSAGDDRLVGDSRELNLSGSDYANAVIGFERIAVRAAGGQDSAQLNDSTLADTVNMNQRQTRLANAESQVTVQGFDRVNVRQVAGGNDQLRMTGTQGADRFNLVADGVSATLANGTVQRAVGFEQIEVGGKGGSDFLGIAASPGEKTLYANRTEVRLEQGPQRATFREFEEAYFQDPDQLAAIVFEDFTEEDRLTATANSLSAQLAELRIQAAGLGYLSATTAATHASNYEMEAVDFLFMLDGQWIPTPKPAE